MNNSNTFEISPKGSCINLSFDKLVSVRDSATIDTKLIFLSQLMSAVENKNKDCSSLYEHFLKEEWRATLFGFLKSCLIVERNRFVIYSARKVLTCLVMTYNSQEGMKIIQELLHTDGQLELICTGLQICKVLCSKKNANHEEVVCQLGHLIRRTWQNLPAVTSSDIIYNQVLLELFSVSIKFAKIVLSKTLSNEPALILKAILSNGEDFNMILHDRFIRTYVKTKLINFLCVLFRQCDLTHLTVLSDEILGIAISLLNKLLSCDMSSILRREGRTTFIGISAVLNDELSCDVSHIRDWTFLCFCLSSYLIHKEDYRTKIETFLIRVDDCVKELQTKYKMSSLPWLQDISTLFLWLPDIYGDQDDKWIDAMILLMDIFPLERKQSSFNTVDLLDQHHLHFLQFVRTLGYDHLVLIDLLTSPETSCLTYLMKYLKYLLSTWHDFISVTRKLQYALNDGKDECYSANDDDYDDVEVDVVVDDDDANKTNLGNPGMVSLQTRIYRKPEEQHESVKDDVTREQIDDIAKTKELLFNHKEVIKGSFELDSNKRNNRQLLASSSLLLIADAYDDDDDGDSVHSHDEKVSINDRKENHKKMLETGIRQSVEKNELDEFHTRKTDNHQIKSQEVRDANKISVPDANVVPKIENISHESDDNNKGLELDYSKVNPEVDITSSVTSIGEVCVEHYMEVDNGCHVDNSGEILDKVMGMIIRTRLQLMKLNVSNLIRYNPQALVYLIESVEELYENN